MDSFFSTLLFVLALCLMTGNVAAAATEQQPRKLGIRLGLEDKIFDPNAFCEHAERQKIRQALWTALGHPVRRVRKGGQPLDRCRTLCEDSVPGNCFLAHPECHGWRKLEENSPIGGALATENYVDPIPDVKPMQNVSGGRFVTSKVVITPSLRRECRASNDAVVSHLKKLATKLQPSCQRLLKKQVDVACFVL